MNELWTTFGQFHNVLVHFPIALVLTALVAEAALIFRNEPAAGTAARFMVTTAAWISVPAALAGFAALSGRDISSALQSNLTIHRAAGIAAPVLIFLAAVFAHGSRRSGQVWEQLLYRILLVIAAIVTALGGLHGGVLAHGPYSL
jgi:uncharacterized membrane protein